MFKLNKTFFIYIDNSVYFYQKDGTFICIPNPDNNSEENMNKALSGYKAIQYFNNQARSSVNKNIKIDEKQRIIIDDEIITSDYEAYYEYYKEQRNMESRNISLNAIANGSLTGFSEEYLNNLRNIYYLGKDLDKNVYWTLANIYILVFNKFGQLIEAFKFDHKKTKILPAIHPDGDVYFLDYDGEQNYLYRINRRW